jgi:hypothetical protein
MAEARQRRALFLVSSDFRASGPAARRRARGRLEAPSSHSKPQNKRSGPLLFHSRTKIVGARFAGSSLGSTQVSTEQPRSEFARSPGVSAVAARSVAIASEVLNLHGVDGFSSVSLSFPFGIWAAGGRRCRVVDLVSYVVPIRDTDAPIPILITTNMHKYNL